jgi:hypothetical protein
MGEADTEIEALAARLRRLKAELGSAYWQDRTVLDLQQQLKLAIGTYGAWSEDKPPMHRRARVAAGYEHAFAGLLWPGRADD